MSNHNYTQYANKKKHDHKANVDDTANMPIPETVAASIVEPVSNVAVVKETVDTVAVVKETVDTVVLPQTVTGIVVNCAKLNVRANPSTDADVLCVLNSASEIEIDVTHNDVDGWYRVCTATGIEGYCMKKFVNAHL